MTGFDTAPSRILIVDDQEPIVDLMLGILESGGYHDLVSTTNPRRVQALYRECNPDLVLVDLHMPHMNGVEVVQALMAESAGMYLPVVVLTADATPEAKRSALAAGAKDFLVKPFDTTEVLLRIKNLLETRALYRELKRHSETLDQRVKDRTRQLAEAQIEILNRLAVLSEYQDDDTSQHTQRVGALAAMVAHALGQSEEEAELLRLAAPLHDVGKIGVPNHILLKTDKLSPSEFEIMRSHTTVGGEVLAKSRFPVLQLARQIALYHHERWDGSGYPQRLKGDLIPLPARIVAVVDAFDALFHGRPYKKSLSFQEAKAEIRSQAGRQFDPQIVEAFVRKITLPAIEELISGTQSNRESSIRALGTIYDAQGASVAHVLKA